MMTKYCKGCGVRLQDEDREALGYTPKLDKDYCQRCFRIRHYDDVMISMQQGIDGAQVLQRIARYDALILWVVDIFDFEANHAAGPFAASARTRHRDDRHQARSAAADAFR